MLLSNVMLLTSVIFSANTYSAYYVMSDLNYGDDSYLESDYFVSGDTGTEITLEEGTYVELYNMCLIAIRS